MSRPARLTALAALAALAACESKPDAPPAPPPPEPTGPDGLVAVLARSQPFDCLPDRATWNALVTPPYQNRAADPLGLESYRLVRIERAPLTARPLFADDATTPASLRRARPATPVGTPPLVAFAGATALPALFAYRDGRWWCLVDLDGMVLGEIADDACRAAYRASESGRCLDLTAPIAAAVLTHAADEERRLCALLVAHGCGSVPAQLPAQSPP
jgi:hypothetical protein